jgi:hypothetical protein
MPQQVLLYCFDDRHVTGQPTLSAGPSLDLAVAPESRRLQ